MRALLVAMCVVAGLGQEARAELLWSRQFQMTQGAGSAQLPQAPGMNFGFGNPPDPGQMIFDQWLFHPTDVGTTFSEDPQSPDYAYFVDLITNGSPTVTMGHAFGIENELFRESSGEKVLWFGGSTHNGFDFAGYDIDALTFTLDSYDRFVVRDVPIFRAFGTVRIYGEYVPEPGAFGMLLVGVALATALHWRRRCMA